MTLNLRHFKSYLVNHKDKAYWDIDALRYLLSLGNPGDVFIANSPRNYGKTYSAIELAKEALERGESVAYGRYNKPELATSISDWLNKCPELVPIKIEGSQLKWFEYPKTGALIAFFIWNIAQNVKGTDWPFKYIICDEFIPERYTKKTRLDTEFSDWTSVYKSLARSYNPTVIMIANNIQWINPFYIGWGIMPVNKGDIDRYTTTFNITVDGEQYKTRRTIVIENCPATPPIIKRNLKQQAISFNSEAELKRYFDNETKKEYTKIAKCPDLTTPLMNVQIMSEAYYMRPRSYNGLLYWSKVTHDRSIKTITSEGQYVDYEQNTFRNKPTNQALEDVFNNGLCVFDTPETLNAFMRFLRHNRGLDIIT